MCVCVCVCVCVCICVLACVRVLKGRARECIRERKGVHVPAGRKSQFLETAVDAPLSLGAE